MIVKFFERITRENWGFPWHILLACIGQMLGIAILLRIAVLTPTVSLLLSALVIFLIGWIYEAWQKRRDNEDPKGSKQDLVANIAGIALGSILFWL